MRRGPTQGNMKTDVMGADRYRWLVLLLRLGLGGVFVASSLGKLAHPALFTQTVVDYGLLPHSLARFYGDVLPWAELAVGCCLILCIFPRLAAAATMLMSFSFIVAGIYSFFHPVGDLCSCFGELVTLTHSQALVVDFAMLGAAGLIVLHRESAHFVGVGPLLERSNLGARRGASLAIQVAMVALAVFLGASLVGNAAENGVDPDGRPTLLIFWNGCPDCVADDAPIIDRLKAAYGDRVAFHWTNYDSDRETAKRFNVKESFALLLVTGEVDGEDCVIHGRFGSPLDEDLVRDSLDRLLSEGAS